MHLFETASIFYAFVLVACVVLKLIAQGGHGAEEAHALDMVHRAQKMYDLNSEGKVDEKTALQRLAAAQATLQCARQLMPDHALERISDVDVTGLAKRIVRDTALLHKK